MQKDYILQIRVKNGPLLRAIREAGHSSVVAFCREYKLEKSAVYLYLGLKRTPLNSQGKWNPNVLKMSEALRRLPGDLFPPQHIVKALRTNSGEFEASAEEIAGFLLSGAPQTPEEILIAKEGSVALDHALATLNPRERSIIEARFGLGDKEPGTLKEIAKEEGVGQERIRQIEAKALQKLRHPSRAENLRHHFNFMNDTLKD